MPPDPLISLPLGVVALGLLALLGLVGLLGARVQHRIARRQVNDLPELLVGVLASIPSGALVVDASGRVLAQNEASRQHLRLSLGSAVPNLLAEASARVIRGRSPEVSVLPAPEGGGRLLVDVSPLVIQGVSELVLMVLRGNGGEGRAARSRQLLGALSHELRTLLTAIMGHMDILASSGPDEEDLRRRSERMISSEAARLARLVEDMLQLSRLESAPFHMQPVNIRSVAEEAISTLYAKSEQAEVALLLKASANLPRVLGDADRLQQVLINLIDNGIKYTPRGGSLSVSLAEKAEDVEVKVEDGGSGISTQDLPDLFEPFFRGGLAERGAPKGTGLGLAIVKTILDQHQTEIAVESKPGEGSRFSFRLKSLGGAA